MGRILFFAGICAYMIYCVYKARSGERSVEGDEEIKLTKSWMLDVVLVIAGLALLVWGSGLLVDNAVIIATGFGMERGGNRFDDRGSRDKYAGTGNFRGGCLEKTYGYCYR